MLLAFPSAWSAHEICWRRNHKNLLLFRLTWVRQASQVEMKRNHDLICLKKQRSNLKAPRKLVCHIEGFKFMQLWFLSSLRQIRKKGKDLLLLAGNSHLRFLFVFGKKIFKDAEFNWWQKQHFAFVLPLWLRLHSLLGSIFEFKRNTIWKFLLAMILTSCLRSKSFRDLLSISS